MCVRKVELFIQQNFNPYYVKWKNIFHEKDT